MDAAGVLAASEVKVDRSGVPVGAQSSTVESAADRAYRHAKDAILSRRYAPHDLLTEGELAGAVGVSRTPVREALLRLQADGLVRLLPKRGALVLPVTAAEIADVLETRRLIEAFAVRKAVARANTDLIVDLSVRLEHMVQATRRRDVRAYVEADRAFHAAIVAFARNEILNSLYSSLRDRQLRMGAVNLFDEHGRDVDAKRMRTTIGEHQAILDAIATRTSRAAETAVSVHLDHAERLLGRP